MSNFAIVRLGKDSVKDIKSIDALHTSPIVPLALTVTCAQVSQDLQPGDYAFLCLGSDNNQGQPTAWIRGLRAIGRVTAKAGGASYNDQCQIGIEIKVVLPQSVTKKDLLAKAPTAYFWFSDIPVMGVDVHSNQTVQMIKTAEPNQSISAMLYGLSELFPSFENEAVAAYPDLAAFFNYLPPPPTGGTAASGSLTEETIPVAELTSLDDMIEQFMIDASGCSLRVEKLQAQRLMASLLSKRFLIATGLAGSGKTKLSQAISRWISPLSTAPDPFEPGTKIKSETTTYFAHASDKLSVEFWNAEDEANAVKVTLPREMIEEWAAFIRSEGLTRATPAGNIRDLVKPTSKFSSQLHSFETHLKAAAFALIDAQTSHTATQCFEIVPVGADWTGNENVLGYPNGLDAKEYIAKPALSLMLRAANNPEWPHFLILDEMNLSHVERYFSDILSAVESDEPIHLHADSSRLSNGQLVPGAAALPKNFFIIGTVNVDETTYMFSPKVLDRANVIEFRMDAAEMAAYLDNPKKPDMQLIAGRGAGFGRSFVKTSMSAPAPLPAPLKKMFDDELVLFFEIMATNGSEFGYRVAHEATRFVAFFKLLGNHDDADQTWLLTAMDCLILQKFLPKLHGSRTKLGPLLKKLWFVCSTAQSSRSANPLALAEAASRSNDKLAEPSFSVPEGAPYQESCFKIARMWRLLNENGFASFAEA
jgi:hypothetical protein